MRSRLGQILLAVLIVACSTRRTMLPPPAPVAPAAPPPAAAPQTVDTTRQTEESLERVDIAALQAASVAVASAEPAPTPAAEALASLRVRVVDEDGNPTPGVKVVLRGLSGGKEQRAASDAHGEVLFQGLTPGDYLLRTDPAELAELTAIPLRLQSGRSPDTIEIRLLTQPHHSQFEEELSRPLVEA